MYVLIPCEIMSCRYRDPDRLEATGASVLPQGDPGAEKPSGKVLHPEGFDHARHNKD